VVFEVKENDSLLEGEIDDTVSSNPASVRIVGIGNTVEGTWVAEWQDDCFGLCNPPEYFFTATLTAGDGVVVRSADPLLEVNKAENIVILGIPQVTATETDATITWSTNIAGSSKVEYGVSSLFIRPTPELDVTSRTTTHSISLSGLNACTLYRYSVASEDAKGVRASAFDQFVTEGCSADVIATSADETLEDVRTGGELSLSDTDLEEISLSIPPDFSTSDAYFQILKLDDEEFDNNITFPTDFIGVGSHVYHLSALLADEKTEIELFDSNLTVKIKYKPEDIEGIDENSLAIYKCDSDVWTPLSNCNLNTQDNSVSCETSSFSDFVLVGKPVSSTPAPPSYATPYSSPYGTPSSGDGGGGGGGYGTPSYGTPGTGGSAGKLGDLNSDGRVNIFDLSILLRSWNRAGQGDLNGDGRVNIFDLSTMLRSWGK
jgi:hypothetical protein